MCSLVNNNENVIVYTATKAQVENYARELLADDLLPDVESENMGMFLQHLENLFKNKKGAQWIVTMALKKGIGGASWACAKIYSKRNNRFVQQWCP